VFSSTGTRAKLWFLSAYLCFWCVEERITVSSVNSIQLLVLSWRWSVSCEVGTELLNVCVDEFQILVCKAQQDAHVTEFIFVWELLYMFWVSLSPIFRSMYGYVHHYSIELIAFSAEYTLFNNCNLNLVCRYPLSVKFNSVCCSVRVTRYCSCSCFVLLKMGDSETRNM